MPDPAATPRTTPTKIGQKDARHLEIAWGDGVVGVLEVRALRLACACAVCVDEWTGEDRLDAAAVPEDVHPLSVRPVGRYALQIDWSDGHQSGIYPFERLRALMDGGPDPKRRTRTG
ncbi:MAG: DUF971 domain-containing protein [Myxococcota bacterium]